MFTVAFLGVYILSKRVERRFRLFHWICGTILGIAMVSYLCMATGLGISYVSTHNPNGHHNSNVLLKREVYWARYVDWLLTTPLLLLDLSLLAGLSPATTVSIIVVDVFMILTGLFSGLMPAAFNDGARARWLFYAISCIAFLVILYTLVVNGRQGMSTSFSDSKTKLTSQPQSSSPHPCKRFTQPLPSSLSFSGPPTLSSSL